MPQNWQNLILLEKFENPPSGQLIAYPIRPLHFGHRMPNSKYKVPSMKTLNPMIPIGIKYLFIVDKKNPRIVMSHDRSVTINNLRRI
jgi:hypothetical protein